MRSIAAIALVVGALLARADFAAATRDSAAIAVVAQYVREHKHWKPTEYRIRRDRTEDQYVVFLVTYLPEQKQPMIGGGETFEAYYDPAQHKVVKEMHFQ